MLDSTDFWNAWLCSYLMAHGPNNMQRGKWGRVKGALKHFESIQRYIYVHITIDMIYRYPNKCKILYIYIHMCTGLYRSSVTEWTIWIHLTYLLHASRSLKFQQQKALEIFWRNWSAPCGSYGFAYGFASAWSLAAIWWQTTNVPMRAATRAVHWMRCNDVPKCNQQRTLKSTKSTKSIEKGQSDSNRSIQSVFVFFVLVCGVWQEKHVLIGTQMQVFCDNCEVGEQGRVDSKEETIVNSELACHEDWVERQPKTQTSED